MNKVKGFLTLLLCTLGVWGANEYYKPKNIKELLKWKGIKLASSNVVWKSMFFENEEELKGKEIYSPDSLWSWCLEKFKATNLNDQKYFEEAKKYCSDNPKTIMARIIREGEEGKVIKKDDFKAFSVNYILADNTQEVLNLIEYEDPKSLLEEVAKKHSQWCESQKRIKIINTEDLGKFSNFKKRCYNRGVKNVSELLRKQGRTPMTKKEQFKEKFNGKFEYVVELMEEIKKSLKSKKSELISVMNSSPEMRNKERVDETILDEQLLKEYGWMLYKSWCEGKLKQNLTAPNVYPDLYKKVNHRCTIEGSN